MNRCASLASLFFQFTQFGFESLDLCFLLVVGSLLQPPFDLLFDAFVEFFKGFDALL